jgi:transcriptional regulator with XRE-family HTH domain
MEFRNRIKDLCKLQGITQKDLAFKLGVSDISLNKTLRGGYPQLQTLEKIALVLNVDIVELFDRPNKSILQCPHCGSELNIKIE